jgi:hypothetical protein
MMPPRWAVMALALALGVGTTTAAGAHALPQATDIRWLGDRAIVRTNRGLVVEEGSGSSFRLLCNEAYGASLAEVVPYELTSDGRILVATNETGIMLSTLDQCGFDAAQGPLAGFIVLDVTGDSQGMFHATVYPVDDSTAALFQSDDDGRSFHYQADLTGVPTSIRVAPSDPTRVYVSTSVPDGNAVAANLEVSTDKGRVFEATPIELDPSELGVLVVGVDPRDPDRVFVRTRSRDGVTPERLLVRNGKSGTLQVALSAPGPISLAWGEDGIAWAGTAQGLFRLIEKDGRFAPATSFDVSRIGCVAARANRLYVCAYSGGEFGVLVSEDEGASFDWFLRFPEVNARLDCPSTSQEGTSCEREFLDWSLEQGLISPEGGAAGEPPIPAGSSGEGSGGLPRPSGGASAGGAPSAGGTAGSSQRGTTRPAGPRGCAVVARPGPARSGGPWAAALVASLAAFARRRARGVAA